MAEKELLHCPYCGNTAGEKTGVCVMTRHGGFLEPYFTLCRKCGASTKNFMTREEAIDAWNRRVKA